MKAFFVLVVFCAAYAVIEAAPTFGAITVTTASASTGLALLGLAKLGTAFALALGQSAARARGKREVGYFFYHWDLLRSTFYIDY